jgi:hypothetical protein
VANRTFQVGYRIGAMQGVHSLFLEGGMIGQVQEWSSSSLVEDKTEQVQE